MQSDNAVLRGAALASLMTVLGSTAAAATRLLAGKATVEQIVFFQYLICLLCVAHLLPSKRKLYLAPDDRLTTLVRGVSGFLGFYFLYLAIRQIALIDAVLLRNTAPFFVPILAAIWLGSKTPLHNWIAIVIGFGGVFLVLDPTMSEPQPSHFVGLLSGFFLAVSMVTTRKLATRYTASAVLFYYYLISIACISPFIFTEPLKLAWQDWAVVLYIGISAHLALVLYTKALTLAKASIIAPLSYLSVVNAGIIGWLAWDQVPSPTGLLGMVIVILAGATTTVMSSRSPQGSIGSQKRP